MLENKIYLEMKGEISKDYQEHGFERAKQNFKNFKWTFTYLIILGMCLRHGMDGDPVTTKTCLGFIVFAFLHAFEWMVDKYPKTVIYLSMGLEVLLFIMAVEANFFLYQD